MAGGIVVGSLMHASGHAFLAAAAGALARSLAGGSGPMDLRSTSWLLNTLTRGGRGDPLLGIAVAGLVAAVVKLAGGVLAAFAEARIAGEVGAALRLEVLDDVLSLHRLRGPRHEDHGSAHRGSALTTYVQEVERGVSHGVLAETRAAVQLVPLALLLVVLAPRLALTATLALLGFAVFAFAVRSAFKRAHRRALASSGLLAGAADEAVRHAELWATYGAERKIRTHVASLGRAIAAEAARLRARGALLSGTSEVLGALALVLALVLVAAGALGGVDRGTLVPFAIAFFMAYRPIRELVDARIARARGEAACAAAVTEGGRFSKVRAETTPRPHRRVWPLADLVIEGVLGEHAAHLPVTLHVPAGAIAAVVGPTGVGKTQLVRALLGLAAPRAGHVYYAGTCLDDAGIGPQERPFAWVPQDAPVLSDTLAANVSLAARADDVAQASPASILGAIGAADLALKIGDAPLVTKRAISGGERQQIAVARALATELPVLLLDEPTSALDPEAEARLLAALAALRGKRTIVMITHRPAPLSIADVVVALSPDVGTRGSDSRTHDIDHAQGRAGRDVDRIATDELPVEHVRAAAGREA